MTLVVNLYGGPGTGKSTTAALLFGKLKQDGVNAELVTEFAKDLVWEGRHKTLSDQVYIFGKQAHRVERLVGQVDVVITDSPILLTCYYSAGYTELNDLAAAVHKSWHTLNIFLKRDNDNHPYVASGRLQETVQEAEVIDQQLLKLLLRLNVGFFQVKMGNRAPQRIANLVHKIVR